MGLCDPDVTKATILSLVVFSIACYCGSVIFCCSACCVKRVREFWENRDPERVIVALGFVPLIPATIGLIASALFVDAWEWDC